MTALELDNPGTISDADHARLVGVMDSFSVEHQEEFAELDPTPNANSSTSNPSKPKSSTTKSSIVTFKIDRTKAALKICKNASERTLPDLEGRPTLDPKNQWD